MENSFQTSFIPKKPVTSSISDREPKSFLSIITIFLLIVSILIAAGLFVYKTYLTKQKEASSSSLSINRSSFEKDTIDELELFDRRTEAAKTILSKHVVLSPLFSLIGEITIPQIQYTSFDQQFTDKGFFVSMSGVARDYRAIALQAGMFNSDKGRAFKNVLFSNLVKDKNNNVSFSIEFSVDPSILSYENNLLLQEQTSSPSETMDTTETTTDDLINQTQ